MATDRHSAAALLPRRRVLQYAAGAAAYAAAARPAQAAVRPPIRAIAFDAFPVFDPRGIVARAERRFPGQGAALVDAWRRRQFEYQWLRAVGGRYQDFWRATEDALVFAAKSHNLALGADQRADLMAGFVELPAWPDAIPSLRKLRAAGLRLAFLSNFTERMLRANIAHAGLDGLFEHVLSTDARKTYKPDPRAYELGAKAFGLPASEVLFVAFAGWDAAGAKWYGYPTFWANRAKAPPEELGAVPDAVGAGLADLVNFVLRS